MKEIESLIARATSPDVDIAQKHEAFGELVKRFQDMVYGYAYAVLGDFHLAEDAVQEAFIVAYQNLDKLRDAKAFPWWLKRIVLTQCNRMTRKKSLPTESLEAALDVPATHLDPAEVVLKQEMKDNVLAAIQSLPENERMVTTLFYINGYSQKEISNFLEVPVTTVNSCLHRSRKRLKERMITMVQDTLHEEAPSRDGGFTKRVLEQIQPTPGGSTFVGTLHPVLKAAGGNWSMARLNGTFGYAFTFSMRKGGGEVWQQANIEWWLFGDMFYKIGYEFYKFQATLKRKDQPAPSPQILKELKNRTWEQVKASIDQGIPAIAWQPMTVEQCDSGFNAYEWALLVGYDEKAKMYTARHQWGTKEYTVPYDKFGYSDSVNWYCIFVLGSPKPFNQMAVEVESLEHAVAFAYGRRYDPAKAGYHVDAVGFAAYELWREAFQNGQADVHRAVGHAQFLRNMRSDAAKYLHEIADQFPEAVNCALSDAAAFYEEEVEAATKLMDICRDAVNSGFAVSMRQEAIETLDAALDADKKAIKKIEDALAALPPEIRHVSNFLKN